MMKLNTYLGTKEGEYIRVHKSIARRMYDSGYPVTLLPCRVNAGFAFNTLFFIHPFSIKRGNPEHLFDDGAHDMPFSLDPESFESMVNAYRYYNCCSELGYYPHYFVTRKDHEKFMKEV